MVNQDTPRLVESYMDPHFHLQIRGDMSGVNFNRVVDFTAERLGWNGTLGLTSFPDMVEDKKFEEFIQRPGHERITFGNAIYVPEKGVWIVKVQEVPAYLNGHEVHLLFFGLPIGRYVTGRRNILDIISEGKDLGAKLVFDHPAYTHGIQPHLEKHQELIVKLMPHADGWEIFNAEAEFNLGNLPLVSRVFPPEANEKASVFYQEHIEPFFPHVKPIKSSDGDSLREIGRGQTRTFIPGWEDVSDGYKLTDYLFKGISKSGGQTESSRRDGAIHAMKALYHCGVGNTISRFIRKKE